MSDFTEFLQAIWRIVAPVAATTFAALVIVALNYAQRWLRAKLAAIENETLREAITQLVTAAEQKYGAGNGQDKYKYVESKLEEWGYGDIDPAEIEAEVYWISAAIDKAAAQTEPKEDA